MTTQICKSVRNNENLSNKKDSILRIGKVITINPFKNIEK